MAENGTLRFGDPARYSAGLGDVRINLTITGAGDFNAKLTRLNLKHLDIYRMHESLPRIAYISLPPELTYLSFPVGKAAHIFDGIAIRSGDMVLHSRGEHMHQRTNGHCQWGLISLSPTQLASCGKALTGRPIEAPPASKIFRPSQAAQSGFHGLFRQACRLVETRKNLLEYPEVSRALEQEMLRAIINCVIANQVNDKSKNSPKSNPKTRHHHADLMARFEEALEKSIDRKLNMPALCAAIGVPERTLRGCCTEVLGVSPTRYLLLRRLNRARDALRRANSSRASVAEVARNHQFLELGRFSVMYRAIFGESPSDTLNRDPQT